MININSKLTLLGGQERFCRYIGGLLLLPIYVLFINTVSKIVPIDTTIPVSIYYGVLWFWLLTSFMDFERSSVFRFFGIYFVILLLALFSWLFNRASVDYLCGTDFTSHITFQPQTLLASALYILIGIRVMDYDILFRVLHSASRVGIVLAFLIYAHSVITGSPIHYDDMNYAYALSMLVCILIATMSKNDIYFILPGILCLLIAGTRGPIVCVFAAFILKEIFLEKNANKLVIKVLLFIVLLILLLNGLFGWIVKQIEVILTSFGLNRLRLVEYMESGMLFNSSGRGDYADIIRAAIWKHPIIGYGFGGDRSFLYGSYSHNLFLEIMISVGVIAGTVISAWLLWKTLMALRSRNRSYQMIVMAFLCGAVLKLMFSSSFIISKEFFIFVGFLMNCAVAEQKLENREEVTE